MLMLFMPLVDDDFVFRLETNQMLDPDRFARLLVALADFARQQNVDLQIAELGSGSVWVRFKAHAGFTADMLGIGLAVAAALRVAAGNPTELRPSPPITDHSELAESVADLVDNDAVISATIITRERRIEIVAADMPAVQSRRESRSETMAAKPPLPQSPNLKTRGTTIGQEDGSPNYVTSNGDYVTSGGQRVVSSGRAQRTSTFATQRASIPPQNLHRLALIGTFALANDGTASFHDLVGNYYRVHNPGVELDPVPIGELRVVEGAPYGGEQGQERAIVVYSTSPLPTN